VLDEIVRGILLQHFGRHDRVGGLSPQERRQINHQQNVLSRKIYRAKHDGKH